MTDEYIYNNIHQHNFYLFYLITFLNFKNKIFLKANSLIIVFFKYIITHIKVNLLINFKLFLNKFHQYFANIKSN